MQLAASSCSIKLPMTGFKPGSTGIGSDCPANTTTTTAHSVQSHEQSTIAQQDTSAVPTDWSIV